MKTAFRTGSLVASVALLVSTMSVYAHEQAAKEDPMVQSLEKISGKEFETSFLQQMIQHHGDAVRMSEMVPHHTANPELRKMADEMIDKQKGEIAQLTAWLKSWHGVEPQMPANGAAKKMMETEMEKLEKAKDQAFDRMFLDKMSHHHASAVEMAELAKDKGANPELQDFAKKVIADQTAEIQHMKEMKSGMSGK
jgi:uncharacterized protein (DUF305 family)